jgi:hypothetical protein
MKNGATRVRDEEACLEWLRLQAHGLEGARISRRVSSVATLPASQG